MHRRRRGVNYRKAAKRRAHRSVRREKLNFTPVIVMLCLSVGCGYAAAKYVVEPVVNYEPPQVKETEMAETNEDISGYAVQFGCYSDESAAKNTAESIGTSGIQVILQDDMYKIIGEIYDSKNEAKKALESLPEGVKGFVTTIRGKEYDTIIN